MTTLSKPVVWITGAAGGLGRSLIQEFLASGFCVAASYHRQPLSLEHPNLSAVALDVTVEPSVSDACNRILKDWGRIDVLINNAGITRDSLLPQMSESDWDSVIDTNLRAAFLCSRSVSAHFLERASGHIVNITSFAAKRGHAGQANYVASKAGLIGLTQSLAQELGPHNIQVNAVMPGLLQTAMTEKLTQAQLATLAEGNALRRLNAPDEVARFVRFLTSMANVSGQIFQLDSRISRWT